MIYLFSLIKLVVTNKQIKKMKNTIKLINDLKLISWDEIEFEVTHDLKRSVYIVAFVRHLLN